MCAGDQPPALPRARKPSGSSFLYNQVNKLLGSSNESSVSPPPVARTVVPSLYDGDVETSDRSALTNIGQYLPISKLFSVAATAATVEQGPD